MLSLDAYSISLALFPRLLGVIYLFVFFPFLFQILGLIGEKGILPIEPLLSIYEKHFGWKKFYAIPSVFWVSASDRALMIVPALGTFLGFLLALSFSPPLLLPLLILLHLSIITAGQDFLTFGWELFCCEIGYNAFLISLTNDLNPFAWISLNLLIFRFHLKSGTSKLQSGDPSWRNLMALKYHYETQPLPNAVAWYIHKLPLWFHKFTTVAVLFLEIIVPFGVFGGELLRLITFALLFFLQAMIALSGNYSYLNFLTAVLVVPLVSDNYLSPFFHAAAKAPSPLPLHIAVSFGALFLILLQLWRLWSDYFYNAPSLKFFHHIEPFFFANRYGIFAVMTTERYEIVIEGSQDLNTWQEYLFYYKPSEINRRPRQIAPYQPRLDWSAWFLPFRNYGGEKWLHHLLFCLLEGRSEVLKLLRFNPFPDKPPKYIRANMYLYTFSDWKTKRDTGAWWVREPVGQFSPTMMLKDQ
jgi:lipase maturation factor 1